LCCPLWDGCKVRCCWPFPWVGCGHPLRMSTAVKCPHLSPRGPPGAAACPKDSTKSFVVGRAGACACLSDATALTSMFSLSCSALCGEQHTVGLGYSGGGGQHAAPGVYMQWTATVDGLILLALPVMALPVPGQQMPQHAHVAAFVHALGSVITSLRFECPQVC
jgi:hypothetical protein